MSNSIPASFASNNSVVTTGPNGQRAHHQQFVHMERLAEGFHQVTENVWCQVGNGLSNQNKYPNLILRVFVLQYS